MDDWNNGNESMEVPSGMAVFAGCVRPTTGSSLTVKLPPFVGPHDVVEYIGDRFDWGFIPLTVAVLPEDYLNNAFGKLGKDDEDKDV